MNLHAMQEATRAAVQKKFGRKKYLVSRAVARYPESAEREYIRMVNAYMTMLNKTLVKHLPTIRKAITAEEDSHIRHDEDGDLQSLISKTLSEMEEEFIKMASGFDMRRRLEKLANLNRKLTVKEWKRVVRKTLGINITDDYYMGGFFRETLNQWVQTNVNLIKSMTDETLKSMTNIIQHGYYSGSSLKTLTGKVMALNPSDFGFKQEMSLEAYNRAMAEYQKAKRHAHFIARDQMAKLNAQITRQQQADAGVTEYVWRTVGDGRVRDSHRHLNNRRFKYDEPPIVDTKTGRRANPGEDYQCRCVALPVFNIDTVVLPWEKTEGS